MLWFAQGQVLLRSWAAMFAGGGGDYFNGNAPILSFDGRDVLTDPMWYEALQRNEDFMYT